MYNYVHSLNAVGGAGRRDVGANRTPDPRFESFNYDGRESEDAVESPLGLVV